MVKPRPFILMFGLAAALWASDQPAAAPVNCSEGAPGTPACPVSKQDRKDAKTAFERGLKLQKSKRLDEA